MSDVYYEFYILVNETDWFQVPKLFERYTETISSNISNIRLKLCSKIWLVWLNPKILEYSSLPFMLDIIKQRLPGDENFSIFTHPRYCVSTNIFKKTGLNCVNCNGIVENWNFPSHFPLMHVGIHFYIFFSFPSKNIKILACHRKKSLNDDPLNKNWKKRKILTITFQVENAYLMY